MPETLEQIQARRDRLQEKYDSVAASWSAHSAGDRSYTNHQLAELRREIEAEDAKLARLANPESGRRTVQRLQRGR